MELEIANYTQDNLPIEQYYSSFLNLWSECSRIIHAKVPITTLSALQEVQKVSKRDQFLMKLRSEFKVVQTGLLNRDPVSSLDVCMGELLHEEQWLATQDNIGVDLSSLDMVTVAYVVQGWGLLVTVPKHPAITISNKAYHKGQSHTTSLSKS